METPYISVIVPVYNAECYLSQCVESLLLQSFNKFELILVNDGSTDDSGKLCDMYAQKDYRVVVLHQANAGVSTARNAGLSSARGKYIAFVDSDDFCDQQMLMSLVAAVDESGADFGVAGYSYYFDEGRRVDQTIDVAGACQVEEFVSKHLKEAFQKNILSGPCSKLYRREIISKYKLRYLSEYSIGEDGIFSYDYLYRCSTIVVLPVVLYYYRQRDDGEHLMSTYHANAFEALGYYYQSVINLCAKYHVSKDVLNTIDNAFLSRLLHCLGQIYGQPDMVINNKRKELLRLASSPFFQMLMKKTPQKVVFNSKEAILVLLLRMKMYWMVDCYWRKKRGGA